MKKSIEVGHIYAPHYVQTKEEIRHTATVGRLAHSLTRTGDTIVTLVDDVVPRNEQRKSQDSWRWQMFINRTHESVEKTLGSKVAFESTMEVMARKISEQLATVDLPEGVRWNEKRNKLIFGSGKSKQSVSIAGYSDIHDRTYPSCEVLELGWIEERLKDSEVIINILPQEFLDQQKRVELLAGLLPQFKDKQISTVLTNEAGDEMSIYHWESLTTLPKSTRQKQPHPDIP